MRLNKYQADSKARDDLNYISSDAFEGGELDEFEDPTDLEYPVFDEGEANFEDLEVLTAEARPDETYFLLKACTVKEEGFEELLNEMANEREDISVGFRGGMFKKTYGAPSQFAVFNDDEEDLSYVNDKEGELDEASGGVQFQFWVKGRPKAEEEAVAEEEPEE